MGGILIGQMPPISPLGVTDHDHDRDSLYLSTDPQAAAGHRTPLVVPKPVPSFARTSRLLPIHRFVMPV
jgi:hypothetical protein